MIKQVIIIRKDLSMRKGKFSAQAAHASLKVFTDRGMFKTTKNNNYLRIKLWDEAIEWLRSGSAKICVYVNSESELIEVHTKALNAKIPAAMITDSGRTEFGGVPTITTVAIGPYDSAEIDKITGHLKLL